MTTEKATLLVMLVVAPIAFSIGRMTALAKYSFERSYWQESSDHHERLADTWKDAAKKFEERAYQFKDIANSNTIALTDCLAIAKRIEADLDYHNKLSPSDYPHTFVDTNRLPLFTVQPGWTNVVFTSNYTGTIQVGNGEPRKP